jgi:hypothetical protein
VGHAVCSGGFEARNFKALFFVLGWTRRGYHKKRARTRYNEVVFLHLEGSAGHVLRSGASRMISVYALFFMLEFNPV